MRSPKARAGGQWLRRGAGCAPERLGLRVVAGALMLSSCANALRVVLSGLGINDFAGAEGWSCGSQADARAGGLLLRSGAMELGLASNYRAEMLGQ